MAFEFPATTLYDRTGAKFEFTSLEALAEFLENESREWSKITQNLPEYLRQSKIGQAFSHVHSLYSIIARVRKLLSENAAELDIINAWNGFLEQRTYSFADPSRSNSSWISITNPAVQVWRQATQHDVHASNAFFNYLCEKKIERPSSAEHLLGALLAYEFQMQGDSAITQRRQAEEVPFEQLRSQLLQRKNQLIEEIAQIQTDHSEWFGQVSTQWSASQQERQSAFESQSQSQQKQFTQLMQEKNQKMAELEHTYQEKLRLQGPADYWKTRARALQTQGRWFAAILALVIATSTGLLSVFFFQWISNGKPLPIELHSLQGVLLFASIVSLIAYAIKTLARLTFSSFHLQRDAEERVELTHLYLALNAEANVDADSRKILYQALFSRSETGLLHKEQGPTMPSLADAVMQAKRQ